jgi:hypothetical protein
MAAGNTYVAIAEQTLGSVLHLLPFLASQGLIQI